MYKVQTKTGYISFSNKSDADNYQDFLDNGLRIVGKSCGAILFNDGSRVYDATMKNSSVKNYVLHKPDDTRITSKRLMKKYIDLIEGR